MIKKKPKRNTKLTMSKSKSQYFDFPIKLKSNVWYTYYNLISDFGFIDNIFVIHKSFINIRESMNMKNTEHCYYMFSRAVA